MLTSVALINRSSLKVTEIQSFLSSVNEQIRLDLRPWQIDAVVYFSGTVQPPSSTRRVYLWDDVQQLSDYGSLGRHELAGGVYTGHVFVKNAVERKRSWTVVTSHEIIELLVDGGLNTYKYRPSAQEFWMLEPADPVEGQSYRVLNADVANFVYPAFYEEGAAGPYDRLGTVKKPFELAENGYADVLRVSANQRTVYGVKRVVDKTSRTAMRETLTSWKKT